MARLNWDKANKQSLMRKYGAEPVNRVKPVAVQSRDTAGIKKAPVKMGKRAAVRGAAPKKPTPEDTAKARTLHFLHDVVRCELLGLDMPEIPTKLREDLEPEIAAFGDVHSWAKVHPEYDKIRQKKAKKLGVAAAAPASGPNSGLPAVAPDGQLLSAIREAANPS